MTLTFIQGCTSISDRSNKPHFEADLLLPFFGCVRQDSGSDPWRRECPPWASGNRKLSNLLKDHSHPRRRASRKSSKRVHDGEPVFNSRTYCYPADCTMQSRSFISGFDPFFFDPTWTRTLTGLSSDQHPQTHSSCVTVGSTQLRIEGWRH